MDANEWLAIEKLPGGARGLIDELRAELDAVRAEIERAERTRLQLWDKLDTAREDAERLRKAGQCLADALRAGSTGNLTGSQLGALKQWETA